MQTLFLAYLYFGLGYSTSCMIGALLDETEETHLTLVISWILTAIFWPYSIWATLYDE